MTALTALPQTFVCQSCKQELPVQTKGGTGYGVNPETKEKTCYACIGEQDRKRFEQMQPGDKDFLYLDFKKLIVTNWPGTFSANVQYFRKSKHNFGGTRTDVWFYVGDNRFHGYSIGDFTQICHVKRVKNI